MTDSVAFLHPTQDKVLVLELNAPQKETPESRIFIVRRQRMFAKRGQMGSKDDIEDIRLEDPRVGIVIDVGKGAYDVKGRWKPTNVKSGQVVVFLAHVGSIVTIAGERYRIVREEELLCEVEMDAEELRRFFAVRYDEESVELLVSIVLGEAEPEDEATETTS